MRKRFALPFAFFAFSLTHVHAEDLQEKDIVVGTGAIAREDMAALAAITIGSEDAPAEIKKGYSLGHKGGDGTTSLSRNIADGLIGMKVGGEREIVTSMVPYPLRLRLIDVAPDIEALKARDGVFSIAVIPDAGMVEPTAGSKHSVPMHARAPLSPIEVSADPTTQASSAPQAPVTADDTADQAAALRGLASAFKDTSFSAPQDTPPPMPSFQPAEPSQTEQLFQRDADRINEQNDQMFQNTVTGNANMSQGFGGNEGGFSYSNSTNETLGPVTGGGE